MYFACNSDFSEKLILSEYCAIVTIDERGQMVLPKEIRERAKIKPGDKLALLSLEKDGKVCCLSLIKVEELEGMVKSRLGPVINEAFKE